VGDNKVSLKNCLYGSAADAQPVACSLGISTRPPSPIASPRAPRPPLRVCPRRCAA
jgi:hypothetical protein